jgi:hypothetical protein
VAAERPLAATRTLLERLTRSGRGDARLEQTITAAGDTVRSARGRIALEPPDRLRLDFEGDGERVTMRADGGEWLQPVTRQMLVLRPGQAEAAVAIWRALLGGGDQSFAERSLGGGRYLLVARSADSGLPDSVQVNQTANGLPERVELWVGEERWSLRLSHWSFSHARGDAAFRLQAPAGYSTFDWP